ncbi:MAG: DUF4255 domain-containing protein [Streptomyces sp.]
MSNALAIATVTQALALLIENNLRPEIDMAVSVETRKPPAEPLTEPTITVFLYQVTPNVSMRHHDLPTRAADGKLLKRPAAPLDLHYLISAYGEETELVGQRLIGCVVRTLHELPVLSQELIAEAAERPYLAGSDLAAAIQKVRFTPTQMDVDETSKLWGMLHQTPYSLSVCYQGALVFVDGRELPVPAPPVEKHTVHVAPFGAPGAPEPPDLPGLPEPLSGSPGPAANGRAAAGDTAASEVPSPPEQPAKAVPPAAKKKRAASKPAAKRTEPADGTARTRKAAGTRGTTGRGGGRSGASKTAGASDAEGTAGDKQA